jgi:hypothetical protein
MQTSALPLLALALASCIHTSPAGTTLASRPPGARVLLDGRDTGWITPCALALAPEDAHVVRFELAGHGARELVLVPERRYHVVDWRLGANGLKSTVRFPTLLPLWDFALPFREARALAPGRVFVQLVPESAP